MAPVFLSFESKGDFQTKIPLEFEKALQVSGLYRSMGPFKEVLED